MRQDELDNRVEEHLKKYKTEVLYVKDKEDNHVNLEDNFIEDCFETLRKYYDKEEFKSYGTDLKSDKIMGMNMVVPLLEDEKLFKTFLSHILDKNLEEISDIKYVEFDKVINNDVNNDIDFFVQLNSGEKIYFEFTYWQDNFGSFIGENNQEIWEKELSKQKDKSLYLKDIGREEFCKNFRLNRNISLIESDKDYLVFIYPFENDALKERMELFKYKNLIEVDLHEIIYFILKLDLGQKLEEYYKEFSRKYLIY
ncbi:MAG: hypothetical protein Q4E02_03420 [Lagierella massiliensis]|nr:hypothetical protein [Lagierella massiliensis]